MADRREVAVELVTRTKPKGFRDLEKETNKATKNLQKFGRRLTAAFGLTKLTQFLVKSVKAFAENEKAVRRLTLELDNLGIAYSASFANEFVRTLSLATGITDDELNPALQKLIRTTYTLTDSQKLLNLAVDITKQTGADLTTVTNALSRAYQGDTKALARLNIGYTAASLKGRNFNEVLKELQAKFGGAAIATQDSYATSIDRLKVAFDEAKEALGEGFVKGLTESGVSVEEFQKTIIKLGEDLGTVLGKAASGIKNLETTLENLSKNPAIKFLLEVLDWLIGVDPSFGAEKAANAAANQVKLAKAQAERYAESLNSQAKLVKLAEDEARLRKERAAELARLKAAEKKAAADKKRTAEIERLRNAITYKFDIDAINQQAALRRNISAADKDRLLQLIALKVSDYQTDEEAIKTLTAATTGKYTEAMALEQMYQLLKLAGFAADKNAITALEKLDPKITFKDNLDEVIAKLKALIEGKYTINIGVNMPGLNLPVPGGQLPERPILPVTPKGEGIPIMPRGPGFGVVPPGVGPEFFEKPGMVVPGFENTLVNPQLNFQAVGGGVFETKTTTGGGLPSFLDYLDATPGSPGFGGRLPFGVSRESIVVNVNAAGSIISQNDLVTAVTDAVYQTQRTGNPLLLSEV